MSEKQALILDFVVGCAITWGSVILLDALGAANKYQGVAAMLGLVATAFMVGVISGHYAKGRRNPSDQTRR